MASDIQSHFKTWLFDKALPFWASVGVDDRGGFHEDVSEQATAPGPSDFKRIRVQARQIYVYAQAHQLNWTGPSLQVAEHGYRFLMNHARLDHGGWAKTLTPDGLVRNSDIDLYDLAFVIFSMAHLHMATDDPEPLRMAQNTVDWVVKHMPHPKGGFTECTPNPPPYRLQNPHMHFLEAILALYEITGATNLKTIAQNLVKTITDNMVERGSNWTILHEYKNPDWSPPADPTKHVWEPGHHFEWAWLLSEYTRLIGGPLPEVADHLYQTAYEYGINDKTHLAFNSVHQGDKPVDANSRLWTNTEAIRGHAAMKNTPAAHDMAQRVFDTYLTPAPDGCWYDLIHADGDTKPGPIPASSFYHIMGAYLALNGQ